jgi:beta-glucosidase
MDIDQTLKNLTIAEKCALLVGQDQWHTYPIPRLGISSIMMADGPHGLRKEISSSHALEAKTVVAVCYPPAVTLASAFDPEITYRVGEAIGKECRKENVHVLLGPGINIKRNPLCGRSFEYYSEDPHLTAEMAKGFVRGLKSLNVGACIKHFALNNQETARMISSSIADERTKHELYYKAFREVVKADPDMVMCSYNKVDGIFASENTELLASTLRAQFGFSKVVVSDWTAVKNRSRALMASLDLEMPGIQDSVRLLQNDLAKGNITQEMMDDSVKRLLFLIDHRQDNSPLEVDLEANHVIARQVAAQSMVLLKNVEGILPLKPSDSIAIIGAMAVNPRYQGGGSSHVNPFRVDQISDLLPEGVDWSYAPGYLLSGDGLDPKLIVEAEAMAKGKDKVVLVIGLTDEYESEGYDRPHLDLPIGHQVLLERIAIANPNLIVVLELGSPIRMPWIGKVKAVLNAYLGGEAGAGAIVDLLYGIENPSGRLAETFANSLEDIPSTRRFAKGNKEVYYQEGLYVGYRYFSSAQKPVLFPFGYGLSYTTFAYSELDCPDQATLTDSFTVSINVKNTGPFFGREVVQLYVRNPLDKLFRPRCELRHFQKIPLEPQAEKRVSFILGPEDFSIYHPDTKTFVGCSGQYEIAIQKNAEAILLSKSIEIHFPNEVDTPEAYRQALSYTIAGGLSFSDTDFLNMIHRPLDQENETRKRPYHMDDTLKDLAHTFIGRLLKRIAVQVAWKSLKRTGNDTKASAIRLVEESTARSLVLFSGGKIKMRTMEGIIHLCNWQFGKAFHSFLKGDKS